MRTWRSCSLLCTLLGVLIVATVESRCLRGQEPKAPEKAAAADDFDVDAVLKRWDFPYQPLTLKSLAKWKLDRKPDHFEFSANGELLHVVFFAEAKHLLFDARDGKLLETIEYGTAPLTAAAISPDGKHLIATLADKGCGVYDIAAKKEVKTFDNMTNVTRIHTTTGKETYLVASQSAGAIFRFPMLGGKGAELPPAVKGPAELRPTARTDIASSADGNYLVIAYPFAAGHLFVLRFGDEGKITEERGLSTTAKSNGVIAVGNRRLGYALTPGQLFFARIFDKSEGFAFAPYRLTAPIIPQLSLSPDDNFSAFYESVPGSLTLRHFTSLGQRAHRFRGPFKPEYMRMNWPQERLALCDRAGEVQLSQVSGYHTPEEFVEVDVQSWLENKQDDRVEKMALALEKDCGHFAGSPANLSKYMVMFFGLTNSTKSLRTINAKYPHLDSWLERNPNSRMARFIHLDRAVSAAWQARGTGFAGTVTEKGWEGFQSNLKKAEEIIDSLSKEPTIPPRAYALIFDTAKGLSWEADKIAPYVDRMLKECPDNFAGHAAYAESLLPRWGGEPDDCKKYADRVLKEVPGHTGEAVYTAIVLKLANYHSRGVYDELGLDQKTTLEGVKHLYKNQLNTPHYRQTEMFASVLCKDHERYLVWRKEILNHRDVWAQGVTTEAYFEKLMQPLPEDDPLDR